MSETLDRRGLAFGISAYVIWGFFPIFMQWLEPAGALEIVAWRSISSLVVCIAIVAVIRAWGRIRTILSDRKVVGRLAAASFLIAINWGTMVYAVLIGQVASTSLGYYINPLLTVGLGVLVLKERLRPLQWTAIGIATVAVIAIAVDMGTVPWISLTLATSFGLYSFIKKAVGHKVDALTGLTLETAFQLPVALGVLVWVYAMGERTLFVHNGEGLGSMHDALLLTTGTWTAGALLLFAAGARRLPLNIIWLLQYIAPTLTFILAVTYFDEEMPAVRWAGFALVWVALVLITVDSWRSRARVTDSLAAESGEVTEPV